MAQLKEIIKQKEAAEESLFQLSGVTGVDVGYKYKDGKRTDEITIRVHVKQKKKNVPTKDKVPETINGIPTDVIEMEIEPFMKVLKLDDATLLADATKYSTVKGGISIGPERSIGGYVFVGTLGCIVKDNVTNNPMLLSNFHVMCVDTSWHVGDYMCQPGRVDGGVPTTDRVGVLHRAVLSNHVDGAISTLSGRPYHCSVVDLGNVKGTASAVLNSAVSKRGRTTLLTKGFVDAINATVNVNYGDGIGVVTLSNQIGIRPDTASNPKFSDHGDSGSVVLDANNKVIGLLFAGNSSTGYTYLNPISYVLSELNISLCTNTKSILKEIAKLEKIEIKELKHEKLEKKEKIEIKEHKNEKIEIKEKVEIKEKFEKPNREGKPIIDKIDKPEDTFDPGIIIPDDPGRLNPGRINPGAINPGAMNPGGQNIEARLAAIEQTLGSLTAFISSAMRPDLSNGALTNEEDVAAAQEKMNKDIADSYVQ